MSEKNEWKSIESAPKDGTEIWAYNGEQARMRWIEGEGYALWAWGDDLLSDTDPNPDPPTHWMPLPAAPGSASSAPGDAQDERQAFEAQPYGWLYDWTHSSATGRPDEHYTGFTKDEQHAKKHDNPRAVYLAAPAAGDALALEDLQKLIEYAQTSDDCQYGTLSTGLVRDLTAKAMAALAAQVPQQGEA